VLLIPVLFEELLAELSASHRRCAKTMPPTSRHGFKSPRGHHPDPIEAKADTMRRYVTATGMALGLLAIWAALLPFAT
jgi:hypothetical protein